MIELKGYVTNLGKYNEGELVGEWVTFPIYEDEKEEIFERINIGGEYEEFFMTDWDCEIPELIKDLGEYESLEYINELAEALENVHDERLLYAALELGGYSEILDIIENIDSYTLLEDVNNDRDLGYYYAVECELLREIPEYVQTYFNFEAYGRDIAIESYGTFTSWGWVEKH